MSYCCHDCPATWTKVARQASPTSLPTLGMIFRWRFSLIFGTANSTLATPNLIVSLWRPNKEGNAQSKKPPMLLKMTKSRVSVGENFAGLELEPDAWLALYIALVHEGLVIVLLVLYKQLFTLWEPLL